MNKLIKIGLFVAWIEGYLLVLKQESLKLRIKY